MSVSLEPQVFDFLRAVKANNNRDWFHANKAEYKKVHENFKAFAQSVHDHVTTHDEIERLKIHRIYRDVRFSKDKTPYNGHFSGSLVRATKWKRGGCYFHIQPSGGSFVGGGFWSPESKDLKRIRYELAHAPEPLREIIADKAFVDTFGTLDGEQLKTAPQGYAKDHPNIDLLRYKQFLVSRSFSDEEVLAPDFAETISDVFHKMRPFFDFMSDVLTTDENGVPLE